MSNAMLGFPNLIDGATLSEGSFVTTLSRDNIKNRVLSKVARTSNATATSTRLKIDLGTSKIVRVFGAFNHNCTLDATYRLRASDDSTFSTTMFDSGVREVWPTVFPYGTLEWEDNNWWNGKYAEDSISGYTTSLITTTPTVVFARYWYLEIFDEGNPLGYIDIGRIFLGRVWQPSLNMNYGASLGWETKTEVQESLNGTEYFQRRNPYRVQKFTLDMMHEDETFAQAFEMMRRAGIDQEVLFIHDPDEATHALRRRFLGRMRQLSPIEYPYFNRNKLGFEIKELL